MSFACPKCGCPTEVILTRQLIDQEGGTVRRRVCHGPLCGHRFYSLQGAERTIPNWSIGWFHRQPIIHRHALSKPEAQP